MAEPFDFNQPITKNTFLVARWKNARRGAYQGDFFRLTTTNGKQYVPTELNMALQAAVAFSATEPVDLTLVDTSTGEISTTVKSNQVVTIEMSGTGWDGLSANTTNKTFFAKGGDEKTALKHITGDITSTALTKAFAAYGLFQDMGSLSTSSIDLTGLRVPNHALAALAFKTALFNTSRGDGLPGTGAYGIIEAVDTWKTTETITFAQIFATNGGGRQSDTYAKGFGFVGAGAQSALDLFPPVAAMVSTTTNIRNTYLG